MHEGVRVIASVCLFVISVFGIASHIKMRQSKNAARYTCTHANGTSMRRPLLCEL